MELDSIIKDYQISEDVEKEVEKRKYEFAKEMIL